MNKYSVQVAIIGADRTAAAFNSVNRRWAAMWAQSRQLGASLGSVGRAIGFPQLVRGFTGVGNAVVGLTQRVRALLGPWAALGVAGGVWAAARALGAFARIGDSLSDAATRIGTTAQKLGELRFMADMMGGSAEGLDGALGRMNKNLANAATGKNDNAAALYRRLGISMRDSKGQIRSVIDILPQLAAAFEKNTNPAVRHAMALALGGEEMVQLIPVLSQGRAAVERWIAESRRAGTMTEQQAAAAAALANANKRLNWSFEGLRNAIGGRLAPIITPMLARLTDWIDANRELIAQRVELVAQRFAEWLGRIDFDKVISGIGDFLSGIESAVAFVGGWENALIGLAVVMNGALIASIISVIGAVAKLGMILWANPIVATIAGIGLAAGVIIANWSSIADWFEGLWDRVATIFETVTDALWGRIKEHPLFRLGSFIAEGIQSLLPDIGRMFDWIERKAAAVGRALGWTGEAPDMKGMTLDGISLTDPGSGASMASGPSPFLASRGIPQPGALPRAAAQQQQAQQLRGSVDVKVDFKNTPPGTDVRAEGSGATANPATRIERSMGDSNFY